MNITTTAHIVIHVVPSHVWEALTDPDTNRALLLKCTPVTGWQSGEEIMYKNDSGTVVATGIVTNSDEPHSLEFTFPVTTTSEEIPTTIQYLLKPHQLKTTLEVIQSGFEANPDGETLKNVAQKHWQEALHKLRNQLEQSFLPFP